MNLWMLAAIIEAGAIVLLLLAIVWLWVMLVRLFKVASLLDEGMGAIHNQLRKGALELERMKTHAD